MNRIRKGILFGAAVLAIFLIVVFAVRDAHDVRPIQTKDSVEAYRNDHFPEILEFYGNACEVVDAQDQSYRDVLTTLDDNIDRSDDIISDSLRATLEASIGAVRSKIDKLTNIPAPTVPTLESAHPDDWTPYRQEFVRSIDKSLQAVGDEVLESSSPIDSKQAIDATQKWRETGNKSFSDMLNVAKPPNEKVSEDLRQLPDCHRLFQSPDVDDDVTVDSVVDFWQINTSATDGIRDHLDELSSSSLQSAIDRWTSVVDGIVQEADRASRDIARVDLSTKGTPSSAGGVRSQLGEQWDELSRLVGGYHAPQSAEDVETFMKQIDSSLARTQLRLQRDLDSPTRATSDAIRAIISTSEDKREAAS